MQRCSLSMQNRIVLRLDESIAVPRRSLAEATFLRCPELSGAVLSLTHRIPLLSLLFVSVLWLVTGCSTVPITGRTQLNMVSDRLLVDAADREFSGFMSLANGKSAILSPSESPQAAAAVGTVGRVSERIVEAAGLRGRYNWETVVVKSNVPNAFVMPNGKIVVFTGLLSVAKTEGGLAAVLGHEVAHVVARHQAERVSQVLLAQLTLAAADAALAASNSKYRPVIGAAIGLGAHFGVLLPFSRAHESEADHIGLLLMAKAGYDPTEAVGLWQRMETAGGSGPWELLSTHPSDRTRVSQIQRWLPEAALLYTDSSRPLPSNLADLRAVTAERANRVALAPIASQPAFQPGFWFQSQSTNRATPTTTQFTRREPCPSGECLVFETDAGATNVYTSDLGLIKATNPSGAWIRFTPPLRSYKWPLAVGDSWSASVLVEESSGRSQTTEMKAHVVAYESTTVPSGSFMAYRVIVSLGGRRFRQVWYAPETRTVVKGIVYDAQGRETTSELVSYQKTDEPIDPLKVPSTAAVTASVPLAPARPAPLVEHHSSVAEQHADNPPSARAPAASLSFAPQSARRPSIAEQQSWILGSWQLVEGKSGIVEGFGRFEFRREGTQVKWRMVRKGWMLGAQTDQEASGSVDRMSDSTVDLTGKYDSSNFGNVVGRPVRQSFSREGDRLSGSESAEDGTRAPLMLRRAQ
jgi:metalloendopeptidase OMA1, mitochondrial